MRIRHTDGHRLGIRILGRTEAQDYTLAVPPMHPDLEPADRVAIFELVLRRLPFEAADLARYAADRLAPRPTGEIDRIAAVMRQPPHHTPRARAA